MHFIFIETSVFLKTGISATHPCYFYTIKNGVFITGLYLGVFMGFFVVRWWWGCTPVAAVWGLWGWLCGLLPAHGSGGLAGSSGGLDGSDGHLEGHYWPEVWLDVRSHDPSDAASIDPWSHRASFADWPIPRSWAGLSTLWVHRTSPSWLWLPLWSPSPVMFLWLCHDFWTIYLWLYDLNNLVCNSVGFGLCWPLDIYYYFLLCI